MSVTAPIPTPAAAPAAPAASPPERPQAVPPSPAQSLHRDAEHTPPGRFVGTLTLRPDRTCSYWLVTESFGYRPESGPPVLIEPDEVFETDGASVPRLLWALLPSWGRYSRAAVIHDYLYERLWKPCPHPAAPDRRAADALFREAMVRSDVPRPLATLMWAAVRAFGRIALARDRAFARVLARPAPDMPRPWSERRQERLEAEAVGSSAGRPATAPAGAPSDPSRPGAAPSEAAPPGVVGFLAFGPQGRQDGRVGRGGPAAPRGGSGGTTS